jgi:hypothetical protein
VPEAFLSMKVLLNKKLISSKTIFSNSFGAQLEAVKKTILFAAKGAGKEIYLYEFGK